MLHVKVLAAKASIGDSVRNNQGENLGEIVDILYDPNTMDIDYAVMSSSLGKKKFVIPYEHLQLIGEKGYFLLDSVQEDFIDADCRVIYQGKEYFTIK
jgi:sporulation protein YlmC with PRC-barrel domain